MMDRWSNISFIPSQTTKPSLNYLQKFVKTFKVFLIVVFRGVKSHELSTMYLSVFIGFDFVQLTFGWKC